MSELGWHMMAALVTYLYLGHVAVEAIGSRCHLPRLPRSVYHLACSRSRCVITLALQALSSTESSNLQMSRLWGQLYVDVSRVRLDSP